MSNDAEKVWFRGLAVAVVVTATVTFGCSSSHTMSGDDASASDTGAPVDGPSRVLDAAVATDGHSWCPDIACVVALDGGCCGTDTRPSRCTPAGPVCDAGYILGSDCRDPSECPAASDWGACAMPSDCVLEANSCCGWCGFGTASDVDAVNRARTAEHRTAVCPVPEPCPFCPAGPLDPDVVATCRLDPSGAGTCAVADLGARAGVCSVDADCIAQYANCCGCGGTDAEVVAVNAVNGRTIIDQLLCTGGSCPLDCAAATPPGWFARCDAGRCVASMAIGP